MSNRQASISRNNCKSKNSFINEAPALLFVSTTFLSPGINTGSIILWIIMQISRPHVCDSNITFHSIHTYIMHVPYTWMFPVIQTHKKPPDASSPHVWLMQAKNNLKHHPSSLCPSVLMWHRVSTFPFLSYSLSLSVSHTSQADGHLSPQPCEMTAEKWDFPAWSGQRQQRNKCSR